METDIQSIGPCEYESPLRHTGGLPVNFKADSERIFIDDRVAGEVDPQGDLWHAVLENTGQPAALN